MTSTDALYDETQWVEKTWVNLDPFSCFFKLQKKLDVRVIMLIEDGISFDRSTLLSNVRD
jgi:hypothetical protein